MSSGVHCRRRRVARVGTIDLGWMRYDRSGLGETLKDIALGDRRQLEGSLTVPEVCSLAKRALSARARQDPTRGSRAEGVVQQKEGRLHRADNGRRLSCKADRTRVPCTRVQALTATVACCLASRFVGSSIGLEWREAPPQARCGHVKPRELDRDCAHSPGAGAPGECARGRGLRIVADCQLRAI